MYINASGHRFKMVENYPQNLLFFPFSFDLQIVTPLHRPLMRQVVHSLDNLFPSKHIHLLSHSIRTLFSATS